VTSGAMTHDRTVSVYRIDANGAAPAYEQLQEQIADRIRRGALPAGAALPTVRGLAAELGLAPNTVARTYRLLEQDGLVVTAGRRGTTVADLHAEVTEEARQRTVAYVASLRDLGISPSEAMRLLRQVLDDTSAP
jgi:DNA-binding transcriptional regulator YhcF (GntR family)